MPKISVIVPVYKTEKYLRKCLDSLVSQVLKDIEIIVVNDGSPDNSIEIIQEFVKLYPQKIKFVNKTNGGLSDARNFGIKEATGDYIGFIDSDDYIEEEMYQELYNKAISNNFDIVASDVYIVYENDDKKEIVKSGINRDYFPEDKLDIKQIMITIYPIACNKIYKRSLFKNLKFKKGVWFEDVEFILRLIPNLNSIGHVVKPHYNYLQRENSLTYTFNEKLYNLIDNMSGVIEYYKTNNLYEEYKEELEYLYVRYAFATFMKRLAKSKNKKEFKDGYEYAVKKVKEYFPDYKLNKYLKKNGLKGYYIKYFNKLFSEITYIVESRKKYN